METGGLKLVSSMPPIQAAEFAPVIFAPENEEPERALFGSFEDETIGHIRVPTPTDPLTRIPLPILPRVSLKELKRMEEEQKANWHHHYHPSDSKLLKSSAGLAVRHVRLQLLPVISHHNAYHSIFLGPELPATNEERFGQIILACANYVPAYAIDMSKDDPTEPVKLSRHMRLRLQSSGEVEVRGKSNIATFIKDHLVHQDFSHVKDSVIDEFLNTRDQERKKNLGHWLLALASEIAVEPIEPLYKQVLDEGLIPKPKMKLPKLAKSYVDTRKVSTKTIRALHNRLYKDSNAPVKKVA